MPRRAIIGLGKMGQIRLESFSGNVRVSVK